MRNTRGFVFFIFGVLLASLTVLLSFWGRTAETGLVLQPKGPSQCCQALLDSICAGDYAEASQYLYGTPKLDADQQPDSETARLIWDAFVDSIRYELVGECYATSAGIAQQAVITSLQIPAITEDLKQQAKTLLETRVSAAENMDDVYDSNLEYREDFVLEVLRDAAAECAAQNSQPLTQELVLNLVYDRDQWWVVPDSALLSAITGGIL